MIIEILYWLPDISLIIFIILSIVILINMLRGYKVGNNIKRITHSLSEECNDELVMEYIVCIKTTKYHPGPIIGI